MAHIRRHPKSPDRWQVRYRGPTGRERSKNFARKIDADRFLHEVEVDKLRGTWTDPQAGRISFAEWAAEVEAGRVDVTPATLARDESILRIHVLPAIGGFELRAIEPAHLRELVAVLQGKGLAPATVHKAAQIAGRILAAAVDDGRLPRSPMRGVTLPRISRDERRFLDASEVAALADTIHPRYRALVLFGAYTGARIGEAAAVRIGDLDLLRRTVYLPGTKTAGSRRTVSVPAFLADAVGEHLATFGPGPDGEVFTGPEGGPLSLTHFRRRVWRPAVKASVGEPMRPHDLRHTHVALLIAAGEDPYVISKRLGHASIRTTYDVYGHLFEGRDRQAADALEEAGRTALERSPADTSRTVEAAEVVRLDV